MLQMCAFGKGVTPGGGMTLTEYRTHYSVWAVLASPLVIGADVRTLDKDHPECLAILTNHAIVSVNQDPAALPPRLVSQSPPFGTPAATTLNVTAQVFARPLSLGRIAVLLLNRGPATAHLAVSWAELGISAGQTVQVFDVISESAQGTATTSFEADVASHDVAFVVLQPEAGAPPLHRGEGSNLEG